MEKLSEKFILKNTMTKLVFGLELMELKDIRTLMEIVKLETELHLTFNIDDKETRQIVEKVIKNQLIEAGKLNGI